MIPLGQGLLIFSMADRPMHLKKPRLKNKKIRHAKDQWSLALGYMIQ